MELFFGESLEIPGGVWGVWMDGVMVGGCVCVFRERNGEQEFRNALRIGSGESSGEERYDKELRSVSGECFDGVYMCVCVCDGWMDVYEGLPGNQSQYC